LRLRLALIVFTVLLGLLATPATFAVPVSFGRNIPFANNSSLNWAGYAVSSSTGSVTIASGSWVQPSITCGKGSYYAAFWVGIDGFNSNTVEQTGTLAQCSNHVASYSAWYEFYPAASVTISGLSVKPGDQFTAKVSYSSTQFTTTITDTTTGRSYSATGSVSSAARSSAECITERPSIGGSITKLADFGTASFSGCTATINGLSGAFGSLSGVQSINMVSRSGSIIAQTSPLGTDLASFTVTWKGSG